GGGAGSGPTAIAASSTAIGAGASGANAARSSVLGTKGSIGGATVVARSTAGGTGATGSNPCICGGGEAGRADAAGAGGSFARRRKTADSAVEGGAGAAAGAGPGEFADTVTVAVVAARRADRRPSYRTHRTMPGRI